MSKKKLSQDSTGYAAAWRDIDTAPKDGTWVLLYDPMANSLIYTGTWDAKFDSNWNYESDNLEYKGAWTSYQAQSFGHEEYATLQPTHWMPLPDPPNVSADSTAHKKNEL